MVLSRHLSEGTEEKHEKFNYDCLYLGRDLNAGPLEYKAGLLTAQPQR
jgi:hypothetical protein